MKKLTIFLLFFITVISVNAQNQYTHQDSLRGSITKERIWWDLLKYDLTVKVNPDEQFISGSNTIQYKVLEKASVMQIDLQAPMKIDKVTQGEEELEVVHDGNAHFIQLKQIQNVGSTGELTIAFSGNPQVAKNAPWDGGFSWKKDSNGNHFVATSCQGLGASVWWPCKDHMYDEPENGMMIHIEVPNNLVGVANGRLVKEKKAKDKRKVFSWEVINPINNYGVNVNIGDYVNFSEVYQGEKGALDMDYWVLRENLEKAKVQFKDAIRTMEAFEHWFGPYPFYEDSYKLVEVPYLGMEHQSSVTYGNDYINGYRGYDLSHTGWGLKWDFIIVHESGHEWFANNITYKDIADMWIHEGFTKYSESLFVEYFYGKEAGNAYTKGHRIDINNDRPIVGDYDVNKKGSSDMYNKGSNMLHTLRQLVDDDEKWRAMLRGINKEFYHQTVTTEQIETYIAESLGLNLDSFFDQYLRQKEIPVFEYWNNDGELYYRWANCIRAFDMPLKIKIDGKETLISPTKRLQKMKLSKKEATIEIDPEFYIYSTDIMGK